MITPKRLVAGAELTTSWRNDLYHVQAPVLSATVKQLVVCNTDVIARSFSYAVVSSSATPADYSGSIMFDHVILQPNETKVFGLTDVVPSSYYIQAKAGEANSVGSVTLTVSGMENT